MPGRSQWSRMFLVMVALGVIAGISIFRVLSSDRAAAKPKLADTDVPSPVERIQVDPSSIAEAIRRGTEWLYGRLSGFVPDASGAVDDREGLYAFRLYTLMRVGRLEPGDGEVKERIQMLRAMPPTTVRAAATRLLTFTRFEPPASLIEEPKLRKDIIRCAQYLVDNQGQDGSWGLGGAIDLPTISVSWRPHQTTRSRSVIRRRGWGSDGDATGTGWAVSGLDACSIAMEGRGALWSVHSDFDCVSQLDTWLTYAQNPDGGWGERRGEASVGSATAVGVSGLSLCLGLNGITADKDVRLQRAYYWIRLNLGDRAERPGGQMPYDQWVYCLRRAAEGRRKLHDDPGDGVERAVQHILDHQDADGGWGTGLDINERTWETCRALLALRMP